MPKRKSWYETLFGLDTRGEWDIRAQEDADRRRKGFLRSGAYVLAGQSGR